MFAFAALVIHRFACCPSPRNVIDDHKYMLFTVSSVLPTVTGISTKRLHMSTSPRCMVIIRKIKTDYEFVTVVERCILMFLPKIDYCYFHLRSALCWSCSTEIITCVLLEFLNVIKYLMSRIVHRGQAPGDQ